MCTFGVMFYVLRLCYAHAVTVHLHVRSACVRICSSCAHAQARSTNFVHSSSYISNIGYFLYTGIIVSVCPLSTHCIHTQHASIVWLHGEVSTPEHPALPAQPSLPLPTLRQPGGQLLWRWLRGRRRWVQGRVCSEHLLFPQEVFVHPLMTPDHHVCVQVLVNYNVQVPMGMQPTVHVGTSTL